MYQVKPVFYLISVKYVASFKFVARNMFPYYNKKRIDEQP